MPLTTFFYLARTTILNCFNEGVYEFPKIVGKFNYYDLDNELKYEEIKLAYRDVSNSHEIPRGADLIEKTESFDIDEYLSEFYLDEDAEKELEAYQNNGEYFRELLLNTLIEITDNEENVIKSKLQPEEYDAFKKAMLNLPFEGEKGAPELFTLMLEGASEWINIEFNERIKFTFHDKDTNSLTQREYTKIYLSGYRFDHVLGHENSYSDEGDFEHWLDTFKSLSSSHDTYIEFYFV